ncbi:hypothetical protein ABZ845_29685 [Streptomyces sp. NPDC047022]|uniref:hypothetical protein n=1 Tax=Streptomyces sp. NPDC047022 TaxID=3155737 RepID=UPI003411D612
MYKQLPSPRRVVLAAAVAAAALSLPAAAALPQAAASAQTSVGEKSTLTADRTSVHWGDVVTFHYSNRPGHTGSVPATATR